MEPTHDQLIRRQREKVAQLTQRTQRAVDAATANYGDNPNDWPQRVADAVERRWQRLDKAKANLAALMREAIR